MNEKSFEGKVWPIPKRTEKEPPSRDAKAVLSSEATEYLRKGLEDLTEKYGKDKRFKKTLERLKKIARKQKKEVLLLKGSDDISAGGGYKFIEELSSREKIAVGKYPEDEILVGERTLNNIRDLLKTDKKFAEEGFADIFLHELQEKTGLAGKANKKKG